MGKPVAIKQSPILCDCVTRLFGFSYKSGVGSKILLIFFSTLLSQNEILNVMLEHMTNKATMR